MDNLINFDVEAKAAPSMAPPVLFPCVVPKVIVSEPALSSGQLPSDLNNPFDIINHKANFADDPFEFTKRTYERNIDELMDGSQFSFECFSNMSSIDSSSSSSHTLSSKESSMSSGGSQKTVVSRSQSDSSTISSKSPNQNLKANVSVDNVQPKNQLLKLSFLNSPNSPMKRSTDKVAAGHALAEARRIAKHFAEPNDMSFEDLNNVSQPPADVSDTSMVDSDLQAMKVDVLKGNHLPPSTPSADQIAMFQERLRLIKKEDTDELEVPSQHNTIHSSSPVKIESDNGENDENHGKNDGEESEVDQLLQKLKSIITEGNKGEAKKHLNRLNELLGKQKDPTKESKNTLHVQPIVRQDTFEIDQDTGNRKYKEKADNNEKIAVINKLNELLKTMTVDVHTINFGDEDASKIVFVTPALTPASTPIKSHPRSSMSLAPKAQSALKAIESKKLGTPMKRQSLMGRPSTFTTPRPMTASKAIHPYEQRLTTVQSRAGAVRKSLLSTIEKSPQVPKPRVSSIITKPPPKPAPSAAPPRRSVSMKATIPITKPSPMKNVPRPSTGAPYAVAANRRLSHVPSTPGRPPTAATTASRLVQSSRARTMSEQKKPVTQFKAPSAFRKIGANDDKGSLV